MQLVRGTASPGLAGVVVTGEKIVDALEANPALAGQVATAQAAQVRRNADSQRPVLGNGAGLLVLVLACACAVLPVTTTACVNGQVSPVVAPILNGIEQIGCELVAVVTPPPEGAVIGTVCSAIASDVSTAVADVSKTLPVADAGALAFNRKTCKLAPVSADGVHGQGYVCDVFAPHVNEVLAAKAKKKAGP